jgi:hypothetical protein
MTHKASQTNFILGFHMYALTQFKHINNMSYLIFVIKNNE